MITQHPLPPALLKVCGATASRDIEAAAAAGAHCVGLWHGVSGGPSELDPDGLAALSSAARSVGLLPVLVTFLADPDRLTEIVRRTGVGWVQLHAYQPPAVVRALRGALPAEVGIIKVLHVAEQSGCVERPLIGAYERAGTDLFLLDTTTEDGRIGSTGRTLDPARVRDLLPRLSRPFLLAGGLTPASRPAHEETVRHPGFRGIDVDTAVRDPSTGGFGRAEVAALARAWCTDTRVPDHPRMEPSR
ncbi:N-(5'-phosphoribosyl)anthranilate isomerase [Kitasatospora sp. NPDC091335]|uniref:phosphoribosylanthranilate isomerase n=1 Tax=Kitasatospora sp. NPDC091335 TaxID=3364085 RepID=UPI00380C9A28